MAQVITNSGHDDMIHDAVLDYYGRRLATCSSDKTIKIFEIEGETHRLTETLRGHDGAVWCVAWAHPTFGTILASSSYDGRVLIWRSTPSASAPGQASSFQKVFESTLHTASVNLVNWAPHEAGCLLACASSDGSISVLEFENNTWNHVVLPGAHNLGVNSVSWAPAIKAGSLISASGGNEKGALRRFVSGGSDCAVKIWDWNPELKTYATTTTLPGPGHSDWVRDVAWSPSVLLKSYIASASQDKTVRIWTSDVTNTATGATEWKCKTLEFGSVLWRVSWSLSGNVLAVSQADNKVSLWKETLKGEWECVRKIEE